MILINSAASAASAAENSAWSRTLAMSLGRNTFLFVKKKELTLEYIMENTKGDQVDVFSEFDFLFGPIRDSWLGGC